MSKFNNILKAHGIIIEQPEAPQQPSGDAQSQNPEASALPQPGQPPAEPTIDNQQLPDSEIKKLSPESFVWLVTVLRSAFLAHPDIDDQKTIAELKGPDDQPIEEINPENAQDVLDAMWTIISKYIPRELKTSQHTDDAVKTLLQKV